MLGWNVNKSYISHKICDNKWGSKNKYKIRGGGGRGSNRDFESKFSLLSTIKIILNIFANNNNNDDDDVWGLDFLLLLLQFLIIFLPIFIFKLKICYLNSVKTFKFMYLKIKKFPKYSQHDNWQIYCLRIKRTKYIMLVQPFCLANILQLNYESFINWVKNKYYFQLQIHKYYLLII